VKYQNLPAFEKHLEQAAKVHLSPLYLVISSCDYERRKIIDKIVSAIRTKEGKVDFQRQDATQEGIEEAIEGLNTTSLWEGKQVLYLDGIEKCKKGSLQLLTQYVARPSPFAYLLLGASSSKSLTDLYTQGKKELISCDLSQEKPWDRKDRFKRYLEEKVAKAGKRLHREAAEHLLEHVGLDLASLEQEIDKLITYLGESREITLKETLALCASQKEFSFWQLAEAVIWSDVPPKIEEKMTLSELLPMITQLRSQLQQGLTLGILLERKTSPTEIASYFPGVKPTLLEKRVPLCRRYPSALFKRALDLLFEMELQAKNSSLEASLLLDLFLSRWTLLKRHVTALPIS